MKTFGLITLYLEIALMGALVVFFIFSPKAWNMDIAFAIPFALILGQLLYAPVIRISYDKLSIFTLFPLNRNINLPFSEINKMTIEINHNMRFIFHLKNGTIVSTICNRYAYDMKPLYRALHNTGVGIESHGIGAIDWVNTD